MNPHDIAMTAFVLEDVELGGVAGSVAAEFVTEHVARVMVEETFRCRTADIVGGWNR